MFGTRSFGCLELTGLAYQREELTLVKIERLKQRAWVTLNGNDFVMCS
jgi:hypothetical protein